MKQFKKAFGSNNVSSLCNQFKDSFVQRIVDLRKVLQNPEEESNSYENSVHSAYLPQMREVDLRCIINNMKASKPAGNDCIRLRDIQHNFEVLKYVIIKIVNESLSSGKVPIELKRAVVRPLYKNGSKNKL